MTSLIGSIANLLYLTTAEQVLNIQFVNMMVAGDDAHVNLQGPREASRVLAFLKSEGLNVSPQKNRIMSNNQADTDFLQVMYSQQGVSASKPERMTASLLIKKPWTQVRSYIPPGSEETEVNSVAQDLL